MTDTVSPTTQFHPYTPPDAIPIAEREQGLFRQSLNRIGINPDRATSAASRTGAWVRRHPGAIVGGLATAVVGIALFRSRLAKTPGARRPETPPF